MSTALREFLETQVSPRADGWDREQRLPREAVQRLLELGLLGGVVTPAGGEVDARTWGDALEWVGAASFSLLSVFTVHAMCAHAVDRWAAPEVKREWLPQLASGRQLGAFALTEPAIGSDAKNVATRIESEGDCWRVNGVKRWISAAGLADVFVVIGRTAVGPTAVLVPRDAPGLEVRPIDGMLGLRAAQLGQLVLKDVRVPKAHLLGAERTGFSHVTGSALDVGRFCIACGCTGLIRACVRASVAYARDRVQFEVPLREHQLIQEMIAEMVTGYKASRALWRHAAERRTQGDPGSIVETTTAKYFASRAASRAASDAVQIHGANGCGPDFPVQRYFRDARIGEIIEGSNQIQQLLIARDAQREFGVPRGKRTS